MKYCPTCINEFRDDVDIDICPDCGEKLLEGRNPRFLEEPEEVDPETLKDLVEVVRVTDQWEADFIKEALQQEGINVGQVPSEQSTLLHIPPVEMTDVIKIVVAEADLDRATEILDKLDRQEANPTVYCPKCLEEIPKDAKQCPHCGEVFEEQ